MVLLPIFELGGNFKNLGVLSTVNQYISTKSTLATTERAYFNSMFTVNYNTDCIKSVIVLMCTLVALKRGNILEKKESITK